MNFHSDYYSNFAKNYQGVKITTFPKTVFSTVASAHCSYSSNLNVPAISNPFCFPSLSWPLSNNRMRLQISSRSYMKPPLMVRLRYKRTGHGMGMFGSLRPPMRQIRPYGLTASMQDVTLVLPVAAGGEKSRKASAWRPAAAMMAPVSAWVSPVSWTVRTVGKVDLILARPSAERETPMTVAPMARAVEMAAPENRPVAGETMRVSPGCRLILRRPP